MTLFRGLIVASSLLLTGLAIQAGGDVQKTQDALLGKWKMDVKTDTGDVYSMTVQFLKNGKLKIWDKIGDAEEISDGTYKLIDDRTLSWEYGGKEGTASKEQLRIDMLTGEKLTFSTGDDAMRSLMEFVRVK